jgi:hypothetical protein
VEDVWLSIGVRNRIEEGERGIGKEVRVEVVGHDSWLEIGARDQYVYLP